MRRAFPLVLLLFAVTSPAAAEIEVERREDGGIRLSNTVGGAYGRPGPGAVARAKAGRSPARPAAPRDLGDLIDRVAMRHGLSPDLVRAVVAVESGFDPRAVSPKGARGLMQLMPATARELEVDDVYDPRGNLEGGARYLRDLLEAFEGDLRLALAAYNAGKQAVRRHGGIPPYPETQQYVRKVMGLLASGTVAGPRRAVPGLFHFRDAGGNVVMSNVPADSVRRPIRVASLP